MGEGAMPRHRQVLAGVLVILIGIAFESWPYIVFGVAMALVPGNEWFTFPVGTDDGELRWLRVMSGHGEPRRVRTIRAHA